MKKLNKKNFNKRSTCNKKGTLVADMFDLLVMVLLAFFAFLFLYLILIKTTAGEFEQEQVKTTEHVLTILYQQGLSLRNPLTETFPSSSNDLVNDYTSLDVLNNQLLDGEASVLQRNTGGARKTLALQQYLPQEKSLPSEEQLSVIGKPSISVSTLQRVLAEENSPVLDAAQKIYDLGVQYSIDPAVALAFFAQESQYGTAKNWIGRPEYKCGMEGSRNLGNIRAESNGVAVFFCKNFDGIKCEKMNFCKYPSWEKGIEVWYALITQSNHYVKAGRTTVDTIVPIYCPAEECNVAEYVANVKSLVNQYRELEKENKGSNEPPEEQPLAESQEKPKEETG